MEKLFNAVFPPRCMFCGYFGVILCYKCLQKCKVVGDGICIICDCEAVSGFTHIQCLEKTTPTSLYCCFEYEGLVQECIKRSKYLDKEFSVLKQLSIEGIKLALKSNLYFDGFVVVPIPLSKKKEKDRGFNQADIIAKEFCKAFGLQMDASILSRVKDTRVQFEIGRNERMKNMRGVFKVLGAKNKRVLLVDDICTTGSTFLGASKALYETGALEVRCFTLSKKM